MVQKAYACAAVAKMEGIEFFYFSYKGIDFKLRKIDGWILPGRKLATETAKLS